MYNILFYSIPHYLTGFLEESMDYAQEYLNQLIKGDAHKLFIWHKQEISQHTEDYIYDVIYNALSIQENT